MKLYKVHLERDNMNDIHENFAAIAVISDLYESGKDIYDVLSAYLQVVISSERMNNFTTAEITERINKTNSFRVNESVVKTALRRLGLKRDHGIYSVNENILNQIDTKELDIQIQQNKVVVEKLCSFIEKETGQSLHDDEKQLVRNQFYRFLMNPEHEDTYSIFISKFIMENSLDDKVYGVILRIKEGLLVYEGISFSPEFGQSGKWDFHLNIFLELEIIFFLAGYNGDIHKDIYRQLIDYVKEINALSDSRNGKWINLYYTNDIKTEIDNYFNTAEIIFEKHEIVDPSKKAMLYILDGVTSKSDIQFKKVQLYNWLSKNEIKEYSIDFFSEENQKYNFISSKTYQQNCERITADRSDRDDDYVIKCTDKINQINIIRKNRNGSLREAKAVLLTANGTILKCSYMENAYQEGEAPKAVDLDYLINRFWYKLNKGLGKGDGPKTIDIISRARMVLASMTVTKVSKTYDEIKQKYADGSITDDEVAGILNELRRVAKNPEDITIEQIDEQISFINDYELTKKIEDFRREEIARQNDRDTIEKLRVQLEKVEELQLTKDHEYIEREKSLENRIVSLEKRNMQMELEKEQLNSTILDFVERDRKKRIMIKRIVHGAAFLALIVILCTLLFLAGRCLLKFDKSISGLISIAITIAFQFIPPIKKLWKKYVIDCEVE